MTTCSASGRRSSWRRSAVTPPTGTDTLRSRSTANGHHDDEAEEPQQSLFSWAEFMAEPVTPKRRNGKPQPASLSMFEWALEQEREKETVGAGR